MKTLSNVRVLWVGGRATDSDHASVWLRSEGAELQRCTWNEAIARIKADAPKVVIADLVEDQAGGQDVLAAIRATPGWRELRIVGVLQNMRTVVAAPEAARCNKYLAVPVHPADLVSAVAGLASETSSATQTPERTTQTHEELYRAIVESHATRQDLRSLLGFVNTTGPFRFTSILRFENDEHLTSLWTYDRENPDVDSFPLDLPVTSSYCGHVRASGEPFVMPDAALDPNVQDHPARHSVLAYCGVPLVREDGTFFGTLCQFDVVPRFFQDVTVRRLSDAASALTRHLTGLTRVRTAEQ